MATVKPIIRVNKDGNQASWKNLKEVLDSKDIDGIQRIFVTADGNTSAKINLSQSDAGNDWIKVYDDKLVKCEFTLRADNGKVKPVLRVNKDGNQASWKNLHGVLADKNIDNIQRIFVIADGNTSAKINLSQSDAGNDWIKVYDDKLTKIEFSVATSVPGPTGGGRDKFGVKCIHPTKERGIEVYIPTSKPDGVDEDDFKSGEYDHGSYHQELNRTRNISGEQRRSNDIHFKKGILNVEAGGYFKFVNDIDDVAIKLRGGHHSDDDDDSARTYIFRVEGDGEKNFGKEYPHNNGKGYSWHTLDTEFPIGSSSSLRDKWVGIKGITYNRGDKVQCDCYLDLDGIDRNGQFDPQRQIWKKWYSITDEDGKYGEDNDDHKTSDAWTTLQRNSSVQCRVDGKSNRLRYIAGETFKFVAAREIDA